MYMYIIYTYIIYYSTLDYTLMYIRPVFWLLYVLARQSLVLRNIIESSRTKMFNSRYLFTLKQPGLPCKLSKTDFKPGYIYRKTGKNRLTSIAVNQIHQEGLKENQLDYKPDITG